jgi:hypothetical protein
VTQRKGESPPLINHRKVKSMKDTKEHLAQLCLIEKILSNVLPERDVNNPYKKHLEKHLSEDQQVFLSLLLSLSKQLTLLYRRHRLELDKNHYQVCREDVIVGLGLLQGQLSPLSKLSSKAVYSYGKMMLSGKKDFARKQAMEMTGYGKTHIQRILNELHEKNIIERTGYRNRGYRYRLK